MSHSSLAAIASVKAGQVQQLLQTCKTFQSADEWAGETDTAANAKIQFQGINALGDQVGKLCEMMSNGRMTHRTGRSPRPSPAISRVFKVPVDRSREVERTDALVSFITVSSEFSPQADIPPCRNFVDAMSICSSMSSTTKTS